MEEQLVFILYAEYSGHKNKFQTYLYSLVITVTRSRKAGEERTIALPPAGLEQLKQDYNEVSLSSDTRDQPFKKLNPQNQMCLMSISCSCPWIVARHLFEVGHQSLKSLVSPRSEVPTRVLHAEKRLHFTPQIFNMKYGKQSTHRSRMSRTSGHPSLGMP